MAEGPHKVWKNAYVLYRRHVLYLYRLYILLRIVFCVPQVYGLVPDYALFNESQFLERKEEAFV